MDYNQDFSENNDVTEIEQEEDGEEQDKQPLPEVLGPNLGKKVSYLRFKDIDAGQKIFYGLPLGF